MPRRSVEADARVNLGLWRNAPLVNVEMAMPVRAKLSCMVAMNRERLQ